MLKVGIDSLNMIERSFRPDFKVIVYFQEPETYTPDDYLSGVGDITTGMSGEGYEVANTTVTLLNRDYYFSKRLARELPNRKLVEIYAGFAEDILLFKGTVNSWQLTEQALTLNLTA